MDNPMTLIKTLTEQLRNRDLRTTIETFVEQHNKDMSINNTILNELKNEKYILERENKEIEDLISELKLTQSKNNEIFNKKNNERYKMASKMVDMEQQNEELDNEIEELTKTLNIKEDEMKSINYPSTEVLYHEIIRGFGVSFVNKNELQYIRIRNKTKNDVFEILLNNGSVEEICEQVWELIE